MKTLIEKLNELSFHEEKEKCVLHRNETITILRACFSLLFPAFYEEMSQEESLQLIREKLPTQIARAFSYDCGKNCEDAEELTKQFLSSLPAIKKMLLSDLEATYCGDPAASSRDEILLCYPGFYAIMIYRLAHQLYQLKIPYLPRILSEFGHSKTGIDIHPGASIGEYFCIDHGTGIVIGETSVIGHHVKIYQGVTIGAKSFQVDENGHLVKGGKRHPDLGNYVTVYANATILGADTFIGDNSIIGANVWITSSVEENQKVYYKK